MGEHFLDAAVIIGQLLSWDEQHRHAHAYFSRGAPVRHTSQHVARGVRSTLLAIRRSFREYTIQLDHDIRGLDGMRIADELRRHVAGYVDLRVRGRTLSPNLARQVRNLARLFENRFRNVYYGSGRAEDLATDVDAAIDKALTQLALMCQPAVGAAVRVHACPADVCTTHAQAHARILAIMGGHVDDSLVAVEALHIHKTTAPALDAIVTTDRGHFLSNKNALDAVLAPIRVLHPDNA